MVELHRSLEDKHFFSLSDIAQLCKVSPAAVSYWRRDGEIREFSRTSRRGKHLVPRHEVIRILKRRQVEAPGVWVRRKAVKMGLLVIDDHVPILKLLRLLVRKWNLPFHVNTSTSVEEGLALAISSRPNVILLDHSFPTNRFQSDVALAFLRRVSVLKRVSVIGMSGDPAVASKMKRNGAVDFVEKPFDMATLRAKLLEHATGHCRIVRAPRQVGLSVERA